MVSLSAEHALLEWGHVRACSSVGHLFGLLAYRMPATVHEDPPTQYGA
jgi:hypothetical protein